MFQLAEPLAMQYGLRISKRTVDCGDAFVSLEQYTIQVINQAGNKIHSWHTCMLSSRQMPLQQLFVSVKKHATLELQKCATHRSRSHSTCYCSCSGYIF